MNHTMKIEGMTCNHCVMSVKSALEQAGGSNVEVSLEKNQATFEAGSDNTEVFKNAVEEQGYDVLSLN